MELNRKKQNAAKKYSLDASDIAYTDLMMAGWDECQAAYFAYRLPSDNTAQVKRFLETRLAYKTGVAAMMCDMRENQKRQRPIEEEPEADAREVTYDLKTKTGMLDYLVDLSSTSGLDVKTKTDLAKQISDLMQFKKEEIKEEDNRINFYLPVTCRYCSLYQDAQKNRKNSKK